MKFVPAGLVALVVVLVFGAGIAGYDVAGRAQASDAVQAVNRDVGKVNAAAAQLDAVTNVAPAYPDFTHSSSPQAFVGQAQRFDAAADQALAELAPAADAVRADRRTLADAQRQLRSASASWLTLLQRTQLEQVRERLRYEQQAVALAQQMVDDARREVLSTRSAIDGLAAYAGLIEKLQGGDLNGSLAAYAGVRASFNQAVADAGGAHLPPVWAALLNDLDRLADDTRGGVQAIQNGDSATAQAKATALDADSKALDGLDTSTLDKDTYLGDLLTQINELEAKAK